MKKINIRCINDVISGGVCFMQGHEYEADIHTDGNVTTINEKGREHIITDLNEYGFESDWFKKHFIVISEVKVNIVFSVEEIINIEAICK